MKVILQQDVAKVGNEGDIVTVADGFARNYLIPRNLAVVATGGALKTHQMRVARLEKKAEELRAQAEKDASALEDKTLKIAAHAGESDRLYGSITSQDIADAVQRDLGISVDKRKIYLTDPIKAIGRYSVPIKLHRDYSVTVNVEVEKAAQ
ncbi:MAG: 50S ribosomal protein L9 [Armatimonadaceae bacterium]